MYVYIMHKMFAFCPPDDGPGLPDDDVAGPRAADIRRRRR